jgi:hypothetical protein
MHTSAILNMRIDLWCLMPLSTIYQLYCGSQFYWWRNRSPCRKPLTYRNSMTNFIAFCIRVHLELWSSIVDLSGVHPHGSYGSTKTFFGIGLLAVIVRFITYIRLSLISSCIWVIKLWLYCFLMFSWSVSICLSIATFEFAQDYDLNVFFFMCFSSSSRIVC